jgi:hypothetical protein
MDKFTNLQQLDFMQKPGIFRTWGGFALRAITIGVIGGALIATVASSCSIHKPLHELATQEPGVEMHFKADDLQPLPPLQGVVDEHSFKYSI